MQAFQHHSYSLYQSYRQLTSVFFTDMSGPQESSNKLSKCLAKSTIGYCLPRKLLLVVVNAILVNHHTFGNSLIVSMTAKVGSQFRVESQVNWRLRQPLTNHG